LHFRSDLKKVLAKWFGDILGSSGKCVPIGEERPKAFLMKVMKNSNSKMQTDKSKCKNVGVSMMPKG